LSFFSWTLLRHSLRYFERCGSMSP
jgi:hypothetical protein